jgi:hypothetical protein
MFCLKRKSVNAVELEKLLFWLWKMFFFFFFECYAYLEDIPTIKINHSLYLDFYYTSFSGNAVVIKFLVSHNHIEKSDFVRFLPALTGFKLRRFKLVAVSKVFVLYLYL